MGGEVLRCGRRTAKGVTGYDLVAGFVGTEGTFGVITELTLKLLPRPPAAATVLGVFADVAGRRRGDQRAAPRRPAPARARARRQDLDRSRSGPRAATGSPRTPARSC